MLVYPWHVSSEVTDITLATLQHQMLMGRCLGNLELGIGNRQLEDKTVLQHPPAPQLPNSPTPQLSTLSPKALVQAD